LIHENCNEKKEKRFITLNNLHVSSSVVIAALRDTETPNSLAAAVQLGRA